MVEGDEAKAMASAPVKSDEMETIVAHLHPFILGIALLSLGLDVDQASEG